MMKTGHHRKKRPATLRQLLLDVAGQISNERGIDALTLNAVAREAGVSKGGLLHHFPSRQALLHGVCDDMIKHLDTEIDAIMAHDPEPVGRFSRAYLVVMSSNESAEDVQRVGALYVAIFAEAGLRKRWSDWLEGRLMQHAETESDPSAAIVRLAADGIWLADLIDARHVWGGQPSGVLKLLIEMSHRS